MARADVLWYGAPPTDADREAFAWFDLRVVVADAGDTPQFERVCGLVVNGFAPHLEDAERSLDHVRPALDCGCLVYVLAEDDATQQRLQVGLNFKHDRIRPYTMPTDARSYACVIARQDVGSSPNYDLDIRGEGAKGLSDEDELLVRRAFSDAVEVQLEPLPAGRSGALVYQADARLKYSLAGARPMPFFVKLGRQDKIAAERRNYEVFAAIHVPFHLRPNLMSERCVEGRSQAALVGSLVENGTPLASVVRGGDGPPAIRYLFSETLMGWRKDAMEKEPSRACLADRLGHLVNSARAQLVDLARSFGDVYEPPELRGRLLGLGQQTFFVGSVHGDLHGENVFVVRGPYAILLDFGSVARGPIVADIANLDVWLACEPSADGDGTPTFEEWSDAMDRLYALDVLVRPPGPNVIPPRFGWLEDAVRELRSCAGDTVQCEQEYPVAVALHLAGRARHLDTHDAHEANRRAYAYYLACRLTDELVAAHRERT
jgi:hypothetical protein